jgi:hypothetical protein
MRKSFMRYAIYSGVSILVLDTIATVFFSNVKQHYNISVFAGYAAIILSLCFIYFGIRYYRDKQNNGMLSFWQGIKTGMLITLVPAVCFGMIDVAYTTIIDPQFYEKYEQLMIARLKASVPAAQFEKEAAALREQTAFFSNPIVGFLLMAITVVAVGLIITVISTFMLKRQAAKNVVVYA